ncbi:MAG: competence/damage-inducible protein A [Myxococcales bacterium]|nr:competence/damage-inducible protein A [Myxococcales bacterium]
MPCAGVVIIGNEILTGKFADENSPWLVVRLRQLGCDLFRVVVIADTLDDIAAEVREQSRRYDWVITTGGVGPTHDDITFAGVAQAFALPLHHHPELVAVLRRKLGDACNAAALRMAEIPEGSALWWDGSVTFPLVVTRNVCIFPGVPSLLRLKFDLVAHRFAGVPVHSLRLRTERQESEIAALLSDAVAQWPMVAIGSYPRLDEAPVHVIVTLESRDITSLVRCEAFLRAGGLVDKR